MNHTSVGETSASYISLNVATISRVVMPLAYRDRIWLSICVIRVFILISWVLPFASVAHDLGQHLAELDIEILPAHDARTILNYIVHLPADW